MSYSFGHRESCELEVVVEVGGGGWSMQTNRFAPRQTNAARLPAQVRPSLFLISFLLTTTKSTEK